MKLMNKVLLMAVAIVACSVSAEAQSRRYSRTSYNYSYNTYPNNTVRVVPQSQTVQKPVVTTPATVTTTAPAAKTTPVTTVSNSAAKSEAPELSSFESEVIAHTNAQRARYGLRPLAICPNLMGSARRHCQWMASANSMTHTSAAVAENIAAGQNSPADAINSWMNSSGHRANILGGGYSTIGVAAFTSPSGQTYWCQQFR